MALNVFELFGKITIDSNGAKTGIDSAVGHAKKAESKLAATMKKIGTAVAAAFTVREIVQFGKQCTQAAADIAAEQSAFSQIMGDYAGTAQQKLDAVSKATGVASTRMTSAFTSMTAKFKGLGEDTADATTLAADGLQIMADAAAFCNMSFSEAQSHLNSFINGSYEGGEAIQLFANDTQMASWAIQQGFAKDKKAWAEMNEGMKQTIRLQYAMAKYKESGIWGQSIVEAEEYGNVLGNLQEAWRQFQGVIGKPILEKIVLPAMRSLTRMMPGLTQAVQSGIDGLSKGFEKLASYFTKVFTPEGLNLDELPKAFETMFRDLGSAIPGLLSNVGQAIKKTWTNAVWPAIQGLFKAAFGIDLPDWATLKQSISDGWNNTVWPAIQDFFTQKFGITLPSWEQLKADIKTGWENTVWPAIKDYFTKPFGISLPAWAQLATDIETGWNNAVWPEIQGLFEKRFGITLPSWETLKTDIKTGWENTVWPAVKDFFTKPIDITLPSWEQLKADIKTGWENTVWPAIQDFFTKKFNITLPSWETLLTDIKNGWNDTVWPAIKDFFKTAFEVALPVWENLKTTIVNAWTNIIVPGIVDCFKTVFEVAMPAWESLKTTIAAGWNDVIWPGIIDLFKTAFEVAMPAWDGLKEIISAGWSDVIWPVVQDLFKTSFNVDLPDWATVAATISGGWTNGIWPAIQDCFKTSFNIDLPSWSSIAQKIKTLWQKVVASVGSLVINAGINVTRHEQVVTTYHTQSAEATQQAGQAVQEATGSNFLSTWAQTIVNQSTVNPDSPWIPGHATGLDYVPYDNYLARLHKGEAVLTSSEADLWRGGNTGRVETALAQMADTLRVIAQNTGAEKQVVLETGVLVGQLAPGIDAQLGMYSNRKGRRN